MYVKIGSHNFYELSKHIISQVFTNLRRAFHFFWYEFPSTDCSKALVNFSQPGYPIKVFFFVRFCLLLEVGDHQSKCYIISGNSEQPRGNLSDTFYQISKPTHFSSSSSKILFTYYFPSVMAVGNVLLFIRFIISKFTTWSARDILSMVQIQISLLVSDSMSTLQRSINRVEIK